MNKLSNKMEELSEKDIYVSLLGCRSSYNSIDFDNFLEYYSFKFDTGDIVVFNNDSVPYESYDNDDYSYIPTKLLEMSDEEFDIWTEKKIESLLAEQEEEKIAQKENLKQQIERLQKQLNNL